MARDSLKLVDLSKVKLWVEMLPNVVLPALLEVEDGAWSFTVTVSVIGEDEKDDLFRFESTCGKDELMSVGGCVSQRPKNVVGLHGITRDNECYSWRPFSRSHSRFSSSNLASKREKGWGGSLLGLVVGNNIGPTKPDALLKARSVRAQFGAKSFGPLAGPIFNQAHETEARSSKGGLTAISSSKLQCSESFAKEVLSIVHSQESSKVKGPSVVARRKARSWPSCLKVSPFAPKCKLDWVVSAEANLAIFRGSLVFNQGVNSPVLEISQDFTVETEGDKGLSRCSLANKVCLPFTASFEKGHPLARAFVPKSLPVSPVSAFHSFRCQPISLIPLESKLCFSGCSLFEFSW